MTMDDLLWNDSWSNQEDIVCEESLFVSSDLNRYSNLPLQELHTVDENFENQKPKQQKAIIEKQPSSTNSDSHLQHSTTSSPSRSSSNNDEIKPVDQDRAVSQMKELIYYAAVFRPVNLGLETVEKKKRRRNVKTSKEPQTVAARERRAKISEKIRALQRLVPGGSKMDTASMLDEAASYIKFLRRQIKALEGLSYKLGSTDCLSTPTSFNPTFPPNAYFPL